MVILVEDVGFGEITAPILVNSLQQILQTFDRNLGERTLFAVHAVRYFCSCVKDRSSDEMTVWGKMASELGEISPVIPNYALDMQTAKG